MRRFIAAATLAATAVLAVGMPAEATAGVTEAGPVTPVQQGDTAVIGGGSGIAFVHADASWGICTLTTIGHDDAGDLVGLTNGHCFRNSPEGVGTPVYAVTADGSAPDWSYGVLGTVRYVSSHVSDGGLDYAVIEFDPDAVTPTATVGQVTIGRLGPAPRTGTVMCKQGVTSGLTCGMMLLRSGTNIVHTIWVAPGDSGAPVAVGDMLIGHTWIAGGSVSILAIVDDMTSRGGPGAGYTPVSPA